MRGPGAVAYRERCHCPAGGRGIPAGDPLPFTAPAWFPPAEISSAGAALKTCPRQVFFTLRQSKENRRGGKMPRLGRFAGIRGSCEAVRRASMAPSTLRLTLAGEEPGPRITTAAEGRGEKSHLPLLLFPRVPLCYALARRSRWPCTLPWRSKYPGAAWTVRRIDVGGRRFELLLFPLPLLGRLRKVPTAALDPELRCCIGRFSFCFFSRGCFPPAKCFPVCHTAGGCGR